MTDARCMPHVRPLIPDDRAAVADLHRSMSDRDERLRFFGARPRDLDAFADGICCADADHLALGAFCDETLVGLAYLVADSRSPDWTAGGAEIAVLVAPDHREKGVGTALVHDLALAAHRGGFHHLTAEILTENIRMLTLVRQQGWTRWVHRDGSTVHLDVDLDRAAADPGDRSALRSGTSDPVRSVPAPVQSTNTPSDLKGIA